MSENATPGEAESTAEAVPAAPPPPPPPVPLYVPPPLPPYAAGSVLPGYAAPTQAYAAPAQAYAPQAQGYAAPPGYAAPVPGYPAPPRPYAAPGYAPPPQGYGPYTPALVSASAAGGSGLGVIAFVLAVIAALGATLLGSIAGFNIGLGTGRAIALQPMDIDFDWSILTPVRGWVLLGELSFWAGTILGIWAIVQGIIAIVKNRGRGWGIAALILALIGPILFATGVQAFLAAGFASGASVGG